MAVTNQTPRNVSTATVGATVFPYDFKVVADTDLLVQVNGVTKTLGVDYTLSGVGLDAGGDVTFLVALTGGQTVLRKRNMTLQRVTDFQNLGDLQSATLNNDQDAPVMMLQQLADDLAEAEITVTALAIEDAVEAAAAAAGSALSAQTSATSATASAVAAAAARDAAQLAANVYATTGAGIAATVSGDYFSVPSSDANEYMILYKNNAGVAQEIKRYINTGPEFGVSVFNPLGVAAGSYPAARKTRGAVVCTQFYAEIIGFGSATITVLVNGAAVHGPVALASGTPLTTAISVSVPASATVTFDISLVVGATSVWAQIDGSNA